MLEDGQTMDKKTSGRSTQPPAKSAPEPRKSDSSSSVRFNRRREPAGSKNGNPDAGRKPCNPAKQGKFVDKRPRPRGQYYGGGKQETKVDEWGEGPENGSAGTSSRKKQNANHLLNFTLAPRPAVGSDASSLTPRTSAGNWLATHKHKYNKEEFLQANCQFVVKSGVDYSPYMVDPDILVDWTYIEQIRLRSAELVACPICLDAPLAAKMTRCGHVYCWPCILHYLALSDKSWRKCPICYESVHKKDLKSVVTISDSISRVGEQFTLKLMKRERGTLLAVPMQECDAVRQPGVPLSVSETTLNIAFSKLLLAADADVSDVTRVEHAQLLTALREAEGEPEVCFIEQAMQLLAEREARHEVKEVAVGVEEVSPEKHEISPVERTNVEADVLVAPDPFAEEEDEEGTNGDFADYGIKGDFAENLEPDCVQNVLPDDAEIESQISGQKPFYFYQAADGQNVFLTALNLRMLETQYGSLAQAPLTITGTVLEKETGSMTRELRNRLRSLSHLPITACFELLELELSSLVSRDVMKVFADTLRARTERRRRRERDERRRDRRITQQVELQWGQKPGHRMRLDSARHFPKCGEDELTEEAPGSPLSVTRSNSISSQSSVSHLDVSDYAHLEREPEPEPPASPPHDSAGPSFAQMLKDGAKPVGWGSRSPAWPQVSRTPAAAVVSTASAGEDAEYGAPAFQNSFSDAIALALDRADFSLGDVSGRGKKKKRKQKVLFASGMNFVSK